MSPAAVQRTQGALPGTTYRRMDETQTAPGMQQARTVETGIPVPGGQAQRLTENLDWREMYKRAPKQGMQTFQALRQMEQGEATTQMTMLSKTIGFLDEVAPFVTDQSSLDKVNAMVATGPPCGESAGRDFAPGVWERELESLFAATRADETPDPAE